MATNREVQWHGPKHANQVSLCTTLVRLAPVLILPITKYYTLRRAYKMYTEKKKVREKVPTPPRPLGHNMSQHQTHVYIKYMYVY